MIVWGGATGSRYDPASDTWTPTATTLAPWGHSGHSAVWTGNVVVLWGGGRQLDATGLYDSPTGVRYDPTTDAWTATSTINAPSPRVGYTAVWTGSRMVVWGGHGIDSSSSASTRTGGRYDPATDLWTSTSTDNAPSARDWHTAEWSGSMMLVWGGYDGSTLLNTGGRYDPATDTWTSMSVINAPSARSGYSSVWAGTCMVVWGGGGNGGPDGDLNSGGRYDPVTDTWTATSTTNAPTARTGHTAVWTGSRMIVWGGFHISYFYSGNGGGLYDPLADTWTLTSWVNAPNARVRHAAVWTGREMLIWGGDAIQPPPILSRIVELGPHGSRYDPVADSWIAMSSLNEPSTSHTQVVWTGHEMIVMSSRGGRYTPSASTLFYRDLDGDGYGDANDSIMACEKPDGYAIHDGDCDEGDPSIHPGAAEVCNGRDDNCNGGIDDEPRASASCDDGDACTVDACRSGICVRTEPNILQAVCTAEPAELNLNSKGREFGVTIVLAGQCPGRRLDPAMLTPLYVAGLASPSLGTVMLPVPDSGPQCTQDGIWETATRRDRPAPDRLRVNFLTHSDGVCSTPDGDRQDIIALLRRVRDRESVQILFASSYPGMATPVQCGATVTVLNHYYKDAPLPQVRPGVRINRPGHP
jgi:putative metal-binding protein/Kelch motif protein